MAYDEGLAQRLREILECEGEVVEKKMFGGLAFMIRGNMTCGIVGDTLMVRVGSEQYADSLKRPHTKEMDFTGKPLKGFVYVEPAGLAEDKELLSWVQLGLDYINTLPGK